MNKPKKKLTERSLQKEAAIFAEVESTFPEPTLFGVTDGKAIGTYLEHKFKAYLATKYAFESGNSANGVDFPDLKVQLNVMNVTNPQSLCPFKSARQRIYGLGYSVLIFVYEKEDDSGTRTAILNIKHAVFVDASKTADYTMTRLIRNLLESGANAEDLIAVMNDRNLPLDEIEANSIADELLQSPCEQGYLTISNALQWRLQFGRAIEQAGKVEGVLRVN